MTADPVFEGRLHLLENEAVAIDDLIRDETRDIRSVLAEHSATLADHSRILADHSRILNDHSRILNDHTVALAEILRRLPEPA